MVYWRTAAACLACVAATLVFLKLVANSIALMSKRLQRLEEQEKRAARRRAELEAAVKAGQIGQAA